MRWLVGTSTVDDREFDWAVPDPAGMTRLPVPLLSRQDKATELARVQAQRAMLAGYEAELIMGLADDTPLLPEDHPAAGQTTWAPGVELPGVDPAFCFELSMILHCGRRSARLRAHRAFTLREKLPATLAALRAGELDERRAGMLVEVLEHARAEVARAVQDRLLPQAAGLAPGTLRTKAVALLVELDAEAVERNRAEAERASDVRVWPTAQDGMSTLAAELPTAQAAECYQLIDSLAAMLKADGDRRPIGQLRCAVLTDLIRRPWERTTPGVTAHLTVVAPLAALAGHSTEAGEVNGLPITAAALRELATRLGALGAPGLTTPPGGAVTVALTDPDGALRATIGLDRLTGLAARGCPTHPGGECGCPILDRPPTTGAYQPTDTQRAFVITRDRRCRFPNCGQRIGFTDLDHVVPHAQGGPTSCTNLCCLCRSHHRLKTARTDWHVEMGDDGTLTVTTPSGIPRTTRPPGLTPPNLDPPATAAPTPDDPGPRGRPDPGDAPPF